MQTGFPPSQFGVNQLNRSNQIEKSHAISYHKYVFVVKSRFCFKWVNHKPVKIAFCQMCEFTWGTIYWNFISICYNTPAILALDVISVQSWLKSKENKPLLQRTLFAMPQTACRMEVALERHILINSVNLQ